LGVQAYEMLSILEGTSSMAQQALQKGSKLKREDTHNLDFYFDKASNSLQGVGEHHLETHQCGGPTKSRAPEGTGSL